MLKTYCRNQKDELLSNLKKRAEDIPDEIMQTVSKILSNVKLNKDASLREYTKLLDKVEIDNFYLTEKEKIELIDKVPYDLRCTIEKAAKNIYSYHEKQKKYSWMDTSDGKIMGQKITPLNRVGLYVPGGTAAYPSTVLMNAIPAKVAEVNEIVIVTPPKINGVNPAVVFAAEIAGIKDIITVGGAQSIAALAYGTETIERVDKIVGPGNIYVTMAKKLVFGTVDIDMIAGPSEVLIIADENANPKFIAADLMSQAEHDPMAASILITTSRAIIDEVIIELEKQIKILNRNEIVKKSLEAFGSAILVDSISEAVELSDSIAPEHLELAVNNPFEVLSQIHNAGSIFLGEYSPEPLGDYFAGPNHVLPTNGTARFSSPLSVDSFIKKSSFLYYNEKSLREVKDDVIRFANTEGLDAHANSIKVRF